MKRLVFFTLGLIIYGLAYSQTDSTKTKLPQEKVTVNKEYDENGNLIKFDSTYVYSWSSDSTFNGLQGDIDFSDFFNWKGSFFSDDSIYTQGPFDGFNFNDDEFENFFRQFSQMYSDTTKFDELFSHKNDSIFKFFNDSTRRLHFKNDDFIKHFNKQLNDSSFIQLSPNEHFFFQNDSIWEKHKKLLEKHLKEIEEIEKNFFLH